MRDAELFASDSLALRPFVADDVQYLFDATQVPAFTRYISWAVPQEEAAFKERMAKTLELGVSGQAALLTAVERTTDRWVSFVLLRAADPSIETGSCLEASLLTHPDFWGQGISTELSQLVSKLVFETTSLNEIVARAAKGNIASNRMLSSIGMQHTGDCELATEQGTVLPGSSYVLRRK